MFFAVILLFIPFFIALWLGVIKLISMMGWQKLSGGRMSPEFPPPTAEKFTMQNLRIGGGFSPANYNNCMNGWIDRNGLYLQPTFIFKFFHPLLYLRWNDIAKVAPESGVMVKRYRLELDANKPQVLLFGRLGQAVFEHWQTTIRPSTN